MMAQPSRRDGNLERPVHLSDDELSAYINGEVTDPESVERFEAHLQECAECRERLDGTRVVVSLLNQTEPPAPPRSFKLEPSMVRPVAVPADSWIIRVQPVMRRLTAVAAVLLLAVVVANVLASRSAGGTESTARDVTTSLQVSGGGAAQSVAGSSSAPASDAAEAATPAAAVAPDVAQNAVAATPEAAQSGSAPPKAQTFAQSGSQQSSPSYWRLSEFALGVIVIWLLFLSVALPRLGQRRPS